MGICLKDNQGSLHRKWYALLTGLYLHVHMIIMYYDYYYDHIYLGSLKDRQEPWKCLSPIRMLTRHRQLTARDGESTVKTARTTKPWSRELRSRRS